MEPIKIPTECLPFVLKQMSLDCLVNLIYSESYPQKRKRLTEKSLLLTSSSWHGKSYVPNDWPDLAKFCSIIRHYPILEKRVHGLDLSRLVDPTAPDELAIFNELLRIPFKRIEVLNLSKFNATRFFFRVMLKNQPWWRNEPPHFLEYLNLSYNACVDSSILCTLLGDYSFRRLAFLDISYCPKLREGDLEALCLSSLSSCLLALGLGGSDIDPKSMILCLPKLQALKFLDLSDCPFMKKTDLFHLFTVCRYSTHPLNNAHFVRGNASHSGNKCPTSSSMECACLLDTLEAVDLSYDDEFTHADMEEVHEFCMKYFGKSLKITHRTCRLKGNDSQSILEYLLQYCE